MRSLALKLTLAFLLIGLVGAALVAVITRQGTRTAFDQFILSRDQQALVDALAQYYQVNHSWKGIAENFQSVIETAPRGFEGRMGYRRGGEHFTLVGADHTVVFSNSRDKVGQSLSSRDLEQAITLKIDNTVVGWLFLASSPQPSIPGAMEGTFLESVNRAILLSALVAAALALTLGGLLAFTLTRPLHELTEATDEIARGKLGFQVKVRSKDEVGELAAAFNKMSLDLARTTQARRQMTADIAHDLRTPLSVITGYTEALSDGKLPGTPEVYSILHQETRHLNHLVEDLRTLSLADAGELSLTLQPTPVSSLLERVAARHAVTAQQKGITLRVEAEHDLPVINVDPQRMDQVFDNLISNAFRFTSQGGEIVLAASQASGSVKLLVRDNGSGITAEDIPYIFDRFYRGDKSRSRGEESGLGLAIAKSIVEAHGGAITVESTPGLGAIFTITLPMGNKN